MNWIGLDYISAISRRKRTKSIAIVAVVRIVIEVEVVILYSNNNNNNNNNNRADGYNRYGIVINELGLQRKTNTEELALPL